MYISGRTPCEYTRTERGIRKMLLDQANANLLEQWDKACALDSLVWVTAGPPPCTPKMSPTVKSLIESQMRLIQPKAA